MADNKIYIDRSNNIPVLMLNRPSKRNALNLEMWQSLISTLEEVNEDPSIQILVISGEGNTFCSGADISEMKEVFSDKEIATRIANITYEAQKKLYELTKPTIAMIRGSCVGGGCGLALCCDFRFGDNTIKMGITPGKIGLVYSLADTKRLIHAVGVTKAKDILFTGRLLDSEECMQIGLVDKVVTKDLLDKTVFNYAESIIGTSKFSLKSNKKIINMVSGGHYDDNAETRRMFIEAFSENDFKEGIDAFLSGRKPNFL